MAPALISDRDQPDLYAMLRAWRSGLFQLRHHAVAADPEAPEVYVARVPSGGGVPAVAENTTGTGTGTVLEDDVASSAVCEIYRVDEAGLFHHAGFTREVFNVSASAIPADVWWKVSRQKFGGWVFDVGGSGADCCHCETALLGPAVELYRTIPGESVDPLVSRVVGSFSLLYMEALSLDPITGPPIFEWTTLYATDAGGGFQPRTLLAHRVCVYENEGHAFTATPIVESGGIQGEFQYVGWVSYSDAALESYSGLSSGTGATATAPSLTSPGEGRIHLIVMRVGLATISTPAGYEDVTQQFQTPGPSSQLRIFARSVGVGDTGEVAITLSASVPWTTHSVLLITSDAPDTSGTTANGDVFVCGRLKSVGEGEAGGAVDWGDVTGTPTTLAGYGITDAASDAELAGHEADTTGVHGIVDTADLALKSGTLAQFTATTSAQLAALISDETGTDKVVFSNAPTLTNPVVGTQAPGDNSTKAASTAYVEAAVAAAPGGDVTGPASSTDNAIARYDGTTGKLLQSSAAIVTDDGGVNAAGLNTFTVTDSDTNVASYVVMLKHRLSSGTAAAGLGLTISFQGVSDVGTDRTQAHVHSEWITATDGAHKARLTLSAADTVPREGVRIEGTGTAAAIAFLGASASPRLVAPDVGTALVTFGLASGTPTFDAANLTGTVSNARLDAELIALANLASAANKVPRFTGSGTADLLDFLTDATLSAASATAIPSQSAVKSYVDNLVTGLNWKQRVRAATTADGTLATAFDDGSVIDGVTLATGDRILVKDQTDQTANGIYVVQAAGAPARASDADTGAELVNATVFVSEGTANADTQWTCTNNSVTLGSTNVAFAQISGAGTYSADETTLTLTGNQFSVKAGGVGTTQQADDSVTLAKMANVATATVFYRKTAGTGDPEVQTLATLKTDLGLSGTNTGDQTITLTGAVTGSGSGSFATTFGDLAALSVLGRGANSAGTPAAIAAANDGEVMRRSGTSVGFGAVNLASANAVTGALPVANLAALNGFTDATPAVLDRVPIYDASAAANRDASVSALLALMAGHIQGFTLANNGTDANNDVDVAAGVAVDSTAAALLVGGAMTKRLDAAWAAGTNQGGIDTGSEAASTWYHVFAILKDSDLTVDYLFSTSATAPTMPAGYTFFRRLGSVYNNASSNIDAFVQDGDYFAWSTPVQDVTATNPGTSAVTRTLSVPLGVRVRVLLYVQFDATSVASNPACIIISDPSTADIGASVGKAGVLLFSSTAILNNAGNYIECWCNTSSQVRSRLQVSAATTVLRMITQGWYDPRGR